MPQHASSTVPRDGVLIIPEESSGKHLHSVITFWLSVQGNFSLYNCLHLPRECSDKTSFSFTLIFSFTSIFTVWYLSFSTIQAAKKQAILINNISVPTGRDEELVPSAHASNDATFCIFSK